MPHKHLNIKILQDGQEISISNLLNTIIIVRHYLVVNVKIMETTPTNRPALEDVFLKLSTRHFVASLVNSLNSIEPEILVILSCVFDSINYL